MYQRKVTLYGVRARETSEDIVGKEIRTELRSVLPFLFSGKHHINWLGSGRLMLGLGSSETTIWKSTSDLLSECRSFVTATRYEQVRTFRQWLLPAFESAVAR